MTDKPTVRIGEIDTVVTDPHSIVPVSAEIITDLRIVDGILFLSLASHVMDGNGAAEARVVSRLRIPMSVLGFIQGSVARILEEFEQAKKAAN